MDVFVARQAIFDRNCHVYGYELLFRSNASSKEFDGTEARLATTLVLANSLLAIGLDHILGGKKAFLNYDRALLLEDSGPVLPCNTAVIEVLETVDPEAEVIEACRRLRQRGYLIALDDFVFRPGYEPLLDVANLVKVDLRALPRSGQQLMVDTYGRRGLAMLAEKVETYEEFQWARNAGYDYFQGYFFARPVTLSAHQIPMVKLQCLRLLREVQRPELDLAHLEALISEDVSFSYRLLRYVNSALFSLPGQVRSIRQALAFLGERNLRKWVTLAALPKVAQDKPSELMAHSLVRARFCESIARLAAPGLDGPAFMMGLFSLIDALIDRPLEEALAEINLAPEITGVLLGLASPEDPLAAAYKLVLAYEAGDWDAVERLNGKLAIPANRLGEAYCEAVHWADLVPSAGS